MNNCKKMKEATNKQVRKGGQPERCNDPGMGPNVSKATGESTGIRNKAVGEWRKRSPQALR